LIFSNIFTKGGYGIDDAYKVQYVCWWRAGSLSLSSYPSGESGNVTMY
jgi:hypothetical protein